MAGKKTILIRVDLVQEQGIGYWHVAEVHSTIWPDQATMELSAIGLDNAPGSEVEPDSQADYPIWDIPLPDAKKRKEQTQGLSVQMGYW